MSEMSCECRRCKPKLNLCYDWCYTEASFINEEGELIE